MSDYGCCPVCGEAYRGSDPVVGRRVRGEPVGDGDTGRAMAALTADPYADSWVHLACTEDAVKRWLRAGRPRSSPLNWIRANGLNWTGLSGHGTAAAKVIG